jgi:hypothetical protein
LLVYRGPASPEACLAAYLDRRVWVLGYHYGPESRYLHLLPCVVVRWPR